MSESAGPPKTPKATGAPGWVVTFADLMAQLMCFFVLIIAFSDSDSKSIIKFFSKITDNFEIKIDTNKKDYPNSNKLVGLPQVMGLPQPTLLKVDERGESRQDDNGGDQVKIVDHDLMGERSPEVDPSVAVNVKKIKSVLTQEIQDGMIDVSQQDNDIIIKFRDAQAFVSNTILIRGDFFPVLDKIRMILAQLPGNLEVAGFADDKQAQAMKYDSSWALSSVLSSVIVQELLRTQEVDKSRFQVTGYADTRPIMLNDTDVNREKNRRIEITIHQDKGKPVDFDKKAMPVGGGTVLPAALPAATTIVQPLSQEKNNAQRGAP